jgi:serine/threonine protein kinase
MSQEFKPPIASDGCSSDGPIDSLCERFDTALKAGEQPKIEDFVRGWEEPERSKLLSELMLLEIEYRDQEGERPVPEQYERRFPNDPTVITEVFELRASSSETKVPSGSKDTLVLHSHLSIQRLYTRGGLGLIYIAVDARLNREVAVKLIRPTLAHDRELCERFSLEAEVTSRLEHPGGVPVYGMGQAENGELFYAMRFVRGETLEQAIRQFHGLDEVRSRAAHSKETEGEDREVLFRGLLGRFVSVCKTIAYAHNCGIVHRDIKPENVILGRYGETLVVDWGLAIPVDREGVFKESAEKTLMPNSGSDGSDLGGGGAGTPAFMSPEQALGNTHLTPATDIYSLGATLYKLLSGKAPFEGSLGEVRSNVIHGRLVRPSVAAARGVPLPLEAICRKAMALQPEQRYATGLDLARDVENYLADAAVSAYDDPLFARLARWGRRHRTLTRSLVGVLSLLTIAGVLLAGIMGRLARQENQLRRESVLVSAKFAARTIANEVDIRLRVLEKEAADPSLHALLSDINTAVEDQDSWKPIQEWLDTKADRYLDLKLRCWFICALDGTQVARHPRIDEDTGQPFTSLGRNYCWRDYFHGKGKDFYDEKEHRRSACPHVHISVAMASTNDGALTVNLSAPVTLPDDPESKGMLGMSIALGEFADLKIQLPAGQKVVLVDARKYYLQCITQDAAKEVVRGEGLILHHKELKWMERNKRLRHLDDNSLAWMADGADPFLPASYHDPVAPDQSGTWLAAFEPVCMNGRPENIRDTGWFIIVQQEQ